MKPVHCIGAKGVLDHASEAWQGLYLTFSDALTLATVRSLSVGDGTLATVLCGVHVLP